MGDWRAAARGALAEGPAALVTVLATEGSAPRGPGARMLVTTRAIDGTIGGGALEYRLAEQARAILDLAPGSWRVQDYPLGPLLGQCCGGRVRVLVERLTAASLESFDGGERIMATLEHDAVARRTASPGDVPPLLARGPLPGAGACFIEPDDRPRRPLLLFGAGHVGRAIAGRLPGLPLQLAWFDGRADMAETPGVMLETEDAMVGCAREAGPETAILILTHDHALDYRLAAAALSGPAGFVGLIGSQTKRARFLSRLHADGIDSSRLVCPIGLPGIVGKEPDVIAIAALAQLLALGPVA